MKNKLDPLFFFSYLLLWFGVSASLGINESFFNSSTQVSVSNRLHGVHQHRLN
jgi:hypothetical protein